MRAFSALPLGVHYFNAHIVGWIARYIVRYRVNVVKSNVNASFPELSQKERNRIIRGYYLHFGQLVCETIWFGGSSVKRIHRSNIARIVNPEECVRLYNETKGTIALYAHLGNWEILGGFEGFNYSGIDDCMHANNVGVVYRRVKDPVWDEIFKENRLHALGPDYDNYVESAGILRHIITHKDDRMFYFINTDQWPYFKAPSYVTVNFMGRKTRTMSGGAAVAQRLGLAVSYVSIRRREGGKKYDFVFKTICDDASTMTIEDIMTRYYELIEEDIKADPANYLWSHRRWKKMPEEQTAAEQKI